MKSKDATHAVYDASAYRVVHVAASVDDPGAGPSYSIRGLARGLREIGAEVRIRSVAGWRGSEYLGADAGMIERYPLNTGYQGHLLCASNPLKNQLKADAMDADILHTHGLWLMPNIYPAGACAAPGRKAKCVVSPRGMLGGAALSFSRWKKRTIWLLAQGSAVRRAHCLHATAESELDEIRAFGLRMPVAVIANGIDLSACVAHHATIPKDQRQILSLGRIHPKKGLDTLIRAWAQIASRRTGWRLRIVGPAEAGHAKELARLSAKLAVRGVSIEPPVFGSEKMALLAQSDLFVLPTLNENFAMTVAEALGAGVPVIATHGAPWAGLQTKGCGWWVEPGVAPLAEALAQATALPAATRSLMGARGRSWMSIDFAWQAKARDMLDVYRWLAGASAIPSCVATA